MKAPRTPGRSGSKYSTPEGARRLRAELDLLWTVERPLVTRAVAEAAAQGDRSENAEYIYGKRRLREIDRRVRYLRGRLDGLKIVSDAPSDRGRVFFGAWVTIEDDSGATRRHRIVGPDEFDRAPGYISMDSPLGRALLGKRIGESVEIELPAGWQKFTVVGIDYEEETVKRGQSPDGDSP
ncbi:MAG: transcription elongation factor GreB [Steroidobacteraceae bacterium]